jgi:hypothetical protein
MDGGSMAAGPFGHSAAEVSAITDLASALAALEEIVEQGEGTARGEVWDGDQDIFHPDRDEAAHYYRMQELKLGRHYQRGDTPESGPTGEPVTLDLAAVAPMKPNPRPAVPGSAAAAAQDDFNNAYCTQLYLLEETFNGSPSTLRDAVRSMYGLKAQALSLLQLPDGAGPTFEYVVPEDRR